MLRGIAKDVVSKAVEQAAVSKHMAEEIGTSLIHGAQETSGEINGNE